MKKAYFCTKFFRSMAEKKSEETLVDVAQAYSKTEHFINENGKKITIALIVIIGVLLAYFAYMKFIQEPKSDEAAQLMWKAQQYFANDSLNLALNGDPNGNPGFLQIIDDFGGTDAAKLAKHYAGACYMSNGDFQSAINMFEGTSFDDMMLESERLGALGDAYVETGDVSTAISYFEKAANHTPNAFTTPIFLKKLGIAQESLGDYSEALESYERIKKEFPESSIGREIDKYIARAAAKS
jgi:tetratricopeptide (TPR) repeat protein